MGSTPVGRKEGWAKGEVEWEADPGEASHNPAGNAYGRVPFGALGAGERGLNPYEPASLVLGYG